MTDVENPHNELARQLLVNVSKINIDREIQKRLEERAKTVILKGFRRGKVPLLRIKQMYGKQIQEDAITNQVNQEFYRLIKEREIKVAGSPELTLKNELGDALQFEAHFEIYPSIKFDDLSELEITRFSASIGDDEIDRTINLLVKQRVTYIDALLPQSVGDQVQNEASNLLDIKKDHAYSASLHDRVTVNFIGTIDGESFDGSIANGFVFILGDDQLLPDFTNAVVGIRVGDTNEFSLNFPDDYPVNDIAGKKAQFVVSVTKIEKALFPEINSAFAMSLGIEDGDCQKMRDEIKQNLILEVDRRSRVALKTQIMESLYRISRFAAPNALIIQDQNRLQALAKQRVSVSKNHSLDTSYINDLNNFRDAAERRVKLGLLINHLIQEYALKAGADQTRQVAENLARNYKNPDEVLNWYYSNESKLLEIEALASEDNIVEFICQRAKVVDKPVSFDELAKLSNV